MNRTSLFVVLVGLGGLVGLFISSGLAEPTVIVRGKDAEKLTALRKERREVLRQAVRQAEEMYRSGRLPYATIPRLTVNLLNAELDLAPDRDARIAIRERVVDQLKISEEMVNQNVKSGQAANTDLLEAKAARLQAEIDLLRETAEGV